MKKIIQISTVYIGIILGAGFASGQEIVQFFTIYQKEGFWGLITAGFLFFIVGWAVLEMTHVYRFENYRQFTRALFGRSLGKAMEWISFLFMCILFCTMLAASGAAAEEGFSVSFAKGSIFMGIACFITFLFDKDGLIAINTALVPFLIFGSFFCGIYTYITKVSPAFMSITAVIPITSRHFILSAFLYVSYNIITAVSVLTSMGELVTSKRIAFLSAAVSGFSMALLGISLHLPLFVHLKSVMGMEIPMLTIIEQYGGVVKSVYLMVLLIAIFTTATANGFGAINYIAGENALQRLSFKILFVVIGVLVAQIGFSNFVGKIYPLFGYAGLFQILAIILYFTFYKTRNF